MGQLRSTRTAPPHLDARHVPARVDHHALAGARVAHQVDEVLHLLRRHEDLGCLGGRAGMEGGESRQMMHGG